MLDYQPEIDLVTGRVLGAEALVRWNSPQHGLVGPEDSSAPPSRAGSSRPSVPGSSTGRSATSRGAARGADPELVLRINVSPLQIAGGQVVARFRRALEQRGVPGTQVCAEITENVRVADTDQLIATLGGSPRWACTRPWTTSAPATAPWAACAARRSTPSSSTVRW